MCNCVNKARIVISHATVGVCAAIETTVHMYMMYVNGVHGWPSSIALAFHLRSMGSILDLRVLGKSYQHFGCKRCFFRDLFPLP